MAKGLSVQELFSALTSSLPANEIVAAACQSKISFQISKRRVDMGMTQSDFADYMGVSQGTVSKWENGDFNFTIEKLADIACKLDLELHMSMDAPATATASTVSVAPPKIITSESGSYKMIVSFMPSICKSYRSTISELKEVI